MNKIKLTNNKPIKFDVVSTSGHDEYSLVPQEALNQIRQLTEKEGKWLYIDGEYVNSSEITLKKLRDAESITLTNMIAGGEDSYTVKTKITTSIKPAAILNLDAENKIITLEINQYLIKALSTQIGGIAQDFNNLLCIEATKFVSDIKTAYGHDPVHTGNCISRLGILKYVESLNDVEIELNLNDNVLVFNLRKDKKYAILNLRQWYTQALYSKVTEFTNKEIKEAKELVNLK